MKTPTKRGFFAKAGALLAIAALAFSASPAQAQDAVTDMPDASGVVITKLKQPAKAGTAANGEVQEDITGIAIPGVTFKAYAVPVKDGEKALTPGTNAWQEKIATTTLKQAQDLVELAPTVVREGETRTDGKIIWDTDVEGNQGYDLDRGLYLVRETATPEGVIPAADFLLAVPLTDPSTHTRWLDTIYIYPKSSKVTGSMSVENATDYSVGNIVTWTVNAEIPQIRSNVDGSLMSTDRFGIEYSLTDAELTAESIRVYLPNSTEPLDPSNYTMGLTENFDGENRIGEKILIELEKGTRTQLVDALNTDTPEGGETPKLFLRVEIDTKVVTAGVFSNPVTVYPSTDTSYIIDSPQIKYGDVLLKKTAGDVTGEALNDAVFRVYLTEDAARDKAEEGYLGEWTTGTIEEEHGQVLLEGFRFTSFANGANVTAEGNTADEQNYWLVEMSAPEGQQLLAAPIEFTVDEVNNTVEVANAANTNGFTLPLTGGTGTTLLTILGLGILALVVFVARSRRDAEA